MMSGKQHRQLNRIRQELNLPSLTWKYADEKKDHHLLDKAMMVYLKNNVYTWYFKDVLIYDQKYDLPYYFERIIMTRTQLFFISSQRLNFSLETSMTDNYWSEHGMCIVSPIVLQQFMINRLMELLDVKRLLNTVVKNVVLLKTSHKIVLRDESEYENIKVWSLTDHNLNDFLEYLANCDRSARDVIDDETILSLYDTFARHCGEKSRKALCHVLYCLYHRL